jgi:hypothetical protein
MVTSFQVLRYSYRSASTGLSLLALHAGMRPAITPIITLTDKGFLYLQKYREILGFIKDFEL